MVCFLGAIMRSWPSRIRNDLRSGNTRKHYTWLSKYDKKAFNGRVGVFDFLGQAFNSFLTLAFHKRIASLSFSLWVGSILFVDDEGKAGFKTFPEIVASVIGLGMIYFAIHSIVQYFNENERKYSAPNPDFKEEEKGGAVNEAAHVLSVRRLRRHGRRLVRPMRRHIGWRHDNRPVPVGAGENQAIRYRLSRGWTGFWALNHDQGGRTACRPIAHLRPHPCRARATGDAGQRFGGSVWGGDETHKRSGEAQSGSIPAELLLQSHPG
jgi:hypothetical protein